MKDLTLNPWAFEDRVPEPLPTLLTRDALARELSVSPSQLDRLRRAGLPCLYVSGMPRFELPDVLAWLRSHGGSTTCPDQEPESCIPAGGNTSRASR